MAPVEIVELIQRSRELTPHDEGLMPMRMGSPWRTPDYARPHWRLRDLPEKDVVRLYAAEWAVGEPGQLALVEEAATRAFPDNYSELLRQKGGQEVRRILQGFQTESMIRILDIGAGPGKSTMAIHDALPEELRRKVEYVLLDPSADSLEQAMSLLDTNGLRGMIIHRTDIDMFEDLEPSVFDIVIGVASIHHHSRIPFEIYHKALKAGGWAIFPDWHNSMWEHPARVRQFLEQLEWPDKEKALKNWKQKYPCASIDISAPEDQLEAQANLDIQRFWTTYLQILRERSVGRNALWMLEGHRPAYLYVEGMEVAGFQNVTSERILDDSALLAVTIGQKAA